MTYARPRSLLLSTIVAIVALGAAEDVPRPTISLSLTDPGRSLDRLTAGIYGRAWSQPGVAPLRKLLAEQTQQAVQLVGHQDLAGAIRAATGLRLDVTAYDGDFDQSALGAFLTGEALADSLFQLIAAEAEPIVVDGAEAAVSAGGNRIASYASGLAVGFDGHDALVLPVAEDEADLVATFTWDALSESMTGRGASQELAAEMIGRMPTDWHLRFVPEGLSHRLAFAAAPVGLAPVDQALLAKVPAESAMVLAIGFDAAAWWADTDRLLTAAAATSPEAEAGVTRMRGQLDAVLLMLGIEGGPAALCDAWRGTMLTVMGSGQGLIPSLTIALPRSPGVDTVVTSALGLIGQDAPAEGANRFLVIPINQPDLAALAPGLVLARDASHWLIGTDAITIQDWIVGATGGWLARAAPRLTGVDLATAQVVGWSDTPAILRSAVPLTGLAVSQVRQPKLAEAGLELALALARAAGEDLVVGRAGEGDWGLEGSGPLGGLSLMLTPNLATTGVIAGLTLPAMNMARASARRASSMNNMKQLILGCIAYMFDHDQQWPPSLAEMIEATGNEIPPEILVSPGGEGVEQPHYLYVWPQPNAKSMQPVIIENPACQGGRKILVTFADGHVGTYEGELVQRIWERALQLHEETTTTELPIPNARWIDLIEDL